MFAHRGSTVLAPENTREAFDLALRYGADVLETDVRLSRDGVVFVTHDACLERTTNGQGQVRAQTSRSLSSLDAGYRFVDPDGRPARDQGVRLMSLSALLEQYPDTRINVDIKDADGLAAAAVAEVIAERSAEQRIIVGSFHAPTLARFRQLAPGVATAATRNEVAGLYFGRALPRNWKPASLACQWLQIPPSWHGIPLATPGFLAAARAEGLRIAYWTINDPARIQLLRDRGVDAIVTDRPDLARAIIDSD